jgi:hypothetical protein
MNLTPSKMWLVLMLALVGGFSAGAQSNGVPGPADYASFSRFVTERNIFDPNRYARSSPDRPSYHPTVSRSAPSFTLVGTMNYHKGMFAFFDGNSSDLRKVLYQSDSNSIAGYTVAEITPTGVKLQSADKKKTVPMKIGGVMRQVGKDWQLADPGDPAATTMGDATPAAGGSRSDTGSAPAPAGAANDILKKLMEQRAKEIK